MSNHLGRFALLAISMLAASSCSDTEPVITLQPIEARVVDEVAEHLISARWTCRGGGCADSDDIGRLASAIRRHSARLDVPVDLLVGIAMVEDPWLDTLAVSEAGAVGVFQVMPMHRDAWPHCPSKLETIEGSTCRGAEIIADFLRRSTDRREALLRYNGCRKTYCQGYPHLVNNEADLFRVDDE